MGTAPEGRLLFSMSVPIVVSMTVQALYNVVDSIFVSRISENALTAVSLSYPIQMLMISFGVGTGVGINALLSRRLGERRYEEADRAAANGLFLELITAALFALLGLLFVKPFMAAYTGDPEIYRLGVDYLSVCMVFGFGIFMQFACERIMLAQGKTVYTMLMQLLGAIVNIVLDPILIFGLLGFPALGVKGAAIATVAGQMAGMLLGFYVLFFTKHDIHIRFRGFRPSGAVIRDIYQVGASSIVLQSLGTVMNLCMNAILIGYTATAVAVFGAYFKLESFVFMPVFGMNGSSMSIMAYNFGARNKKRLLRTWRITLLAALTVMTAGLGVFLLLPAQLLSVFNPSAEMLALGVPALRILSLTFPLAAVTISCSIFFQALGKGVYSMVLSMIRQLVFLIPAAYLFSYFFQRVGAVWWSFLTAELASLVLSGFFVARIMKTLVNPLERADA